MVLAAVEGLEVNRILEGEYFYLGQYILNVGPLDASWKVRNEIEHYVLAEPPVSLEVAGLGLAGGVGVVTWSRA